MKTIYSPSKSLVNLSNTILARFQAPTHHDPIPELLTLLSKKEKIVCLLFDGMGQTILRRHLPFFSWLRQKKWTTITSVFPSTTAAATTAFLSGKYPIEIGWLGWAHYFPEYERMLELFTGRDYLLQQPAFAATDIQKTIQFPSIIEQIAQANPKVSLNQVWPDIRPGGAKTIEEWFQKVGEVCKQDGPMFTYGYWLEPDKSIHKLGVKPKAIRLLVEEIQRKLKSLSNQNPDTTFIVFADHGLINIEFFNIQAHEDFYATLVRCFAFEPRAATFFVKPALHERFKRLFHQYYGKYFLLLTKEEVFKYHVYGLGMPHPRTHDFIGDYVAIARGRFAFTPGLETDTMPKTMKAHHAGMTKKEMLIDVMILNR